MANISKTRGFLLAAGTALAMAFTLSCSGDDGDDGGDSPSSSSNTGAGGTSSSSDTPSGSSSSLGGSSSGGSINSFETVTIGNQVWMKKNLNYNAPGSKCYGEGGEVYDPETGDFITLPDNEIQANCEKYGRLYNWATAMALDPSCNSASCSGEIQPKHQGICPDGWRIPSNADWDELFRYVDEQNGGEGSGEGSPYDSYTAGKYLKSATGWNPYDGIENLDTYEFSALPGGYGSSDGGFNNAGDYGYWWSSTEFSSYCAYRRIMDYYYEYADWGSFDKGFLFSVRCLQD